MVIELIAILIQDEYVSYYEKSIIVDGQVFGQVFDCDFGRFVIVMANENHILNGCYYANKFEDLGYSLQECVSGISQITYTIKE